MLFFSLQARCFFCLFYCTCFSLQRRFLAAFKGGNGHRFPLRARSSTEMPPRRTHSSHLSINRHRWKRSLRFVRTFLAFYFLPFTAYKTGQRKRRETNKRIGTKRCNNVSGSALVQTAPFDAQIDRRIGDAALPRRAKSLLLRPHRARHAHSRKHSKRQTWRHFAHLWLDLFVALFEGGLGHIRLWTH